MHHGVGNHRRRRMWRAVDSGAKARWQREYSSQLCRDRRLFWHRSLHALGEPKNAAIGERPITARAGQGQRGYSDRACDAHRRCYWRADWRSRDTIFHRPEDSARLCALAIDRRGNRDLHAHDRPQNLAMKILICSDGTPSAEPPIHLAGSLAGPLKAETTLLGIAETSHDEHPLRDALQKQVQSLYDRGISPDIIVQSGEPVRQIVDQTSKTTY